MKYALLAIVGLRFNLRVKRNWILFCFEPNLDSKPAGLLTRTGVLLSKTQDSIRDMQDSMHL